MSFLFIYAKSMELELHMHICIEHKIIMNIKYIKEFLFHTSMMTFNLKYFYDFFIAITLKILE